MLEFKLIENNNETVTYQYYPEGKKDDFGVITIKKSDSSIVKQSIAKSDEFKTYFFHMLHRIEKFIRNDQFKDEGLIAWY